MHSSQLPVDSFSHVCPPFRPHESSPDDLMEPSSSSAGDDLSSATKPKERKRVQNRVAQRAYRKRVKSHIESLERIALSTDLIEPRLADIDAPSTSHVARPKKHNSSHSPSSRSVNSPSLGQHMSHGTCPSGRHTSLSMSQSSNSRGAVNSASHFDKIHPTPGFSNPFHPLHGTPASPQTKTTGFEEQFSPLQHPCTPLDGPNSMYGVNRLPNHQETIPNIDNSPQAQQTLLSMPFGQGFLTLQWHPGAATALDNKFFNDFQDLESPHANQNVSGFPSNHQLLPAPQLWHQPADWDSFSEPNSCASCDCHSTGASHREMV
ncbi:hypothetical protein XPA_003116 [Xanthoria parietina]